MLLAPEPHLLEDGAYGRSIGRELVLHLERRLGTSNAAGNDALLLQLLQLFDEDALTHQGKFSFDLTVPPLAGSKVDEDLSFVLAFDDLQKGIDGAIDDSHDAVLN